MLDYMFVGLETVDMAIAEMSDAELHDEIMQEHNMSPVTKKQAGDLEVGDEVFVPDEEKFCTLTAKDPVDDSIVATFDEGMVIDLLDKTHTFKVRK